MATEKFSLEKFVLGFLNPGKILFIMLLFLGFTYMKDTVVPRIKRSVETQNIQTYVEAPENKRVSFFGIKINKVGFGFTYEKQ